jgi:hypothetical protein
VLDPALVQHLLHPLLDQLGRRAGAPGHGTSSTTTSCTTIATAASASASASARPTMVLLISAETGRVTGVVGT